MADERITNAELARRLQRIERKLDDIVDQGLARRVERLEENLRWLTRAILGALIVAFVGYLVARGMP